MSSPDPFPLERYKLERLLGRGTFGTVSSYVRRDPEGSPGLPLRVAVKKLRSCVRTSHHGRLAHQRETNIVDNLNHRNIVRFLGAFRNGSEPRSTTWLVMELCEPDLQCLIESGRVLTDQEVHFLFKQMLEATAYIHNKNVIHRDLKPANILFEVREGPTDWETVDVRGLTIKLADLGLSRYVVPRMSSQSMTEGVGTPAYWAPEVISGRYDQKADVYSLGIVAFEMLMRRAPDNPSEAPVTASSLKHNTWTSMNELWSSYLQEMLQEDKERRPSAKSLLDHPFITSL